MRVRQALISSAMLLVMSAAGVGFASAALDPNRLPGIGGYPDPQDMYAGISNLIRGNQRAPGNYDEDANQHPAIMAVSFGGLRARMTVVEVLPTSNYWAELIGMGLVSSRGKFIQVLDPADKAGMDRRMAEKAHIEDFSGEVLDVKPIDYNALAAPGSVDLVLLSKKMGTLMRAGNLERLLTAANAALKPGGILLVEDYRANTDKPQDMKAATGYIRVDYAIQTIQKAGFKLADREDMLLANPTDPKTQAANNSDRFLLKFTK